MNKRLYSTHIFVVAEDIAGCMDETGRQVKAGLQERTNMGYIPGYKRRINNSPRIYLFRNRWSAN
ncbi:MAG: hypothetical protein ACLU4N_18410 [Butyricimonas faecihominis]